MSLQHIAKYIHEDHEEQKAAHETRFFFNFSDKEEIEILFCFVSPYDLGDVPNTCIYLNTIILAFFRVMDIFTPLSYLA